MEVSTLADFVDSTVKEIDSRLKELQAEVSKLQAGGDALTSSRGGSRRPARSTAATTTSAAPRGRRRPGPRRGSRNGNTRATQALDLVKTKPGITIPEIAEAIKIEPNYLYRVMPKLVESGQVKREGQGWHAVAS
jgi:hypothetical protein